MAQLIAEVKTSWTVRLLALTGRQMASLFPQVVDNPLALRARSHAVTVGAVSQYITVRRKRAQRAAEKKLAQATPLWGIASHSQ